MIIYALEDKMTVPPILSIIYHPGESNKSKHSNQIYFNPFNNQKQQKVGT